MLYSKNSHNLKQLYETPEWLELHFEAKYAHRMVSAAMYDIRLGEKIADIGCGTGAWINFFLKKLGGNGYVIGIDPSSENINTAKNKLDKENISNVKLIESDIDTFCKNPEKYDVIHFGNSIGYLKNKIFMFEKLSRKLTPGGRIIIRQHDEATLLMAPVRQALLESFRFQLAKSQEDPIHQLPFDLYAGRNLQFELLSSKLYKVDMRLIPFEAKAPFEEKIQKYIIETCKWIEGITYHTSTEEERYEWECSIISRVQENIEFYFSEIEYLYHAYLLS